MRGRGNREMTVDRVERKACVSFARESDSGGERSFFENGVLGYLSPKVLITFFSAVAKHLERKNSMSGEDFTIESRAFQRVAP